MSHLRKLEATTWLLPEGLIDYLRILTSHFLTISGSKWFPNSSEETFKFDFQPRTFSWNHGIFPWELTFAAPLVQALQVMGLLGTENSFLLRGDHAGCPGDELAWLVIQYISLIIHLMIYPPGNDHISHLWKLGKSSTQKCLFGWIC